MIIFTYSNSTFIVNACKYQIMNALFVAKLNGLSTCFLTLPLLLRSGFQQLGQKDALCQVNTNAVPACSCDTWLSDAEILFILWRSQTHSVCKHRIIQISEKFTRNLICIVSGFSCCGLEMSESSKQQVNFLFFTSFPGCCYWSHRYIHNIK